jgi:hypothetical protein
VENENKGGGVKSRNRHSDKNRNGRRNRGRYAQEHDKIDRQTASQEVKKK